MIKFFVILLFLLSSCAYPDIDTVPDFKDVIITKEDSIELCTKRNPYIKSKYYISPSNVLIINPKKILITAVPALTYRYINSNYNYERLKCFEVLDININRYGL